jgi:hypothetical protein
VPASRLLGEARHEDDALARRDVDDVADEIEAALEDIVSNGGWGHAVPTVVNQRFEPDETPRPDDLPDWDLA